MQSYFFTLNTCLIEHFLQVLCANKMLLTFFLAISIELITHISIRVENVKHFNDLKCKMNGNIQFENGLVLMSYDEIVEFKLMNNCFEKRN